MPTVNKLKDAGIGAILDYAAEADVSEADQDDSNTSEASQRAAEEEAASQISEINNVPWHKRARASVPEIASVASNWATASSESMTQPISFIDPSFNRPTLAVRDRLSVLCSAGCANSEPRAVAGSHV